MKLGLALAGGGLKGVSYIGALKALEELGIKFDYISGTSSGSMAAALYAAGYSCDDMKDIILNSYKGLIKIPKRPIVSAIGSYVTRRNFNMQGLIPGERLENVIQKFVDAKKVSNISDVKIPLAITTVDTVTTKECIFMSHDYNLKNDDVDYIYNVPLGKVVRSSMAFPGIFTTSKYDRYDFIDGGTKDNLPIHVLKDMGADRTLGLSFKLDEFNVDGRNVFGTLLRTVDIFSLKDVLAAQKEANLAIEIDASGTSLMEIDDIDKCIDIGYRAIMDNKDEILKLVK
ncbi:MAG: patatin-like phospholipase family protein [Clostridia bacterium]|nr:patatin-like phospholipase family protein [Clostridia bacterium]